MYVFSDESVNLLRFYLPWHLEPEYYFGIQVPAVNNFQCGKLPRNQSHLLFEFSFI